jgi:hypothetical protein
MTSKDTKSRASNYNRSGFEFIIIQYVALLQVQPNRNAQPSRPKRQNPKKQQQ